MLAMRAMRRRGTLTLSRTDRRVGPSRSLTATPLHSRLAVRPPALVGWAGDGVDARSGAGPGWRAAGAGHATGCGWRRPWAPATTPHRQWRLWAVEEVYAVVGAHGRRLVGRVGVEDAYGERLVHVPADLPWGPPVDLGGLLGGLRGTGDRFGAEDQGDHAKVHVLVHAGEPHRAYGQPGLLLNLAA